MKASALFAACMAMVISLSAHTNNSNLNFAKCRDYVSDWEKGLSIVQLIEKDLTLGTWTNTVSNGNENTYLFTEEGLLQILVTDKKGFKSYESTFWRVSVFDNQPFLVLSNNNREEKLMRVDQTCNGLTLTDMVASDVMLLDYQPIRASKKLNLTKAYMVGEWTNVTAIETNQPEKAFGAHINYQFEADGTFTYDIGNNDFEKSKKGTWQISKDGQFLLLHVAEGDNLETIEETQVIRIAQVDDHGLMLEHVMKSNEVKEYFNGTNKVFAFIK